MRDKLVIISKKLAGWSFFGMFVYIIIANIFKLNPAFAVLFFIATFFFFGLMTVPTRSNMKFISAWMLPITLMSAVIGLTLIFIPLFFNLTVDSRVFNIGGVFFAISIILFFIVGIFSGHTNNKKEEGESSDDVESVFDEIAKELGLSIKKTKTRNYHTYSAEGSIPEGEIKIEVGVKKGSFRNRSADYSFLTISNVKHKMNENIRMESINDALYIENLPDSINYFIKEKQLDYFNFRLIVLPESLQINIDVALVEKEAWLDYIELIKKLIYF